MALPTTIEVEQRCHFVTTEGERLEYALDFEFKASNNNAEYEALITGIKLPRHIRVEQIQIHSNIQLIVN